MPGKIGGRRGTGAIVAADAALRAYRDLRPLLIEQQRALKDSLGGPWHIRLPSQSEPSLKVLTYPGTAGTVAVVDGVSVVNAEGKEPPEPSYTSAQALGIAHTLAELWTKVGDLAGKLREARREAQLFGLPEDTTALDRLAVVVPPYPHLDRDRPLSEEKPLIDGALAILHRLIDAMPAGLSAKAGEQKGKRGRPPLNRGASQRRTHLLQQYHNRPAGQSRKDFCKAHDDLELRLLGNALSWERSRKLRGRTK